MIEKLIEQLPLIFVLLLWTLPQSMQWLSVQVSLEKCSFVQPHLTFDCLLPSFFLILFFSCTHPPLFLQLPQQFPSSVWTTWKRTTTPQFLGHQCLVPPVPPHCPHALAAPAPPPAVRQAPCCQIVWGRTAGTTAHGPPRVVRERVWLGATPARLYCPRLPWTRPLWMTVHDPSPVPQNPVTPCSGRDTPLRPTPRPQWVTAAPGALPIQIGPSLIKLQWENRWLIIYWKINKC